MKTREEFGQVFKLPSQEKPLVPTEEQWAAITAPLEPCIIIAGAGTGKTTTMASRISYLIATGAVAPEKILGLTFTKKATLELAKAVRARSRQAAEYRNLHFPGDQRAIDELGEPTISNYNSFGARILREHGLRIGVEPNARVLVDATRYQFAARVVSRSKVSLAASKFTNVKSVVELVLSLDEECSNYNIDPDEVIAHDELMISEFKSTPVTKKRIKVASEMLEAAENRIYIAQLVKEFRQAKLAEGVIDYSDQIRLAAQIAETSDEVCQVIRNQFEIVLLDEYQDTSISQKVLLNKLFGNGHAVMAVGDPCQAIYGWRGADVTNIENFTTDFSRSNGEAAHIYELSVNRRSGQLILDAANTLSNPLRQIHSQIVELVAGDKSEPPGEIHTAILNSQPEETVWVCDQIEQQIKSGVAPKDIAILLRVAEYGADYVAELESRNIPVQVANAEVLIHLPAVRDVLCFLELSANPTANTALVRLLSGPKWRIGGRDLALLGQDARKLAKSDYQAEKALPMHLQLQKAVGSTDSADQVCLLDALELVSESKLPYSDQARIRMTEAAALLRQIRKYVGDSALDAITRIIRDTGIGVEAIAKPNKYSNATSDHLGALLDLAGAFKSIDGEGDVHSFLRYLAACETYDKNPVSDLSTSKQAVVIMTAHKAKGLEYPVVAVPLLSETKFPLKPKGGSWLTSAGHVPVKCKQKEIREPRILDLINSLDPRTKQFDGYKEYFKELNILDETRLAYVAATRAKKVLFASGSYWGRDGKSNAWGPTEFLNSLIGHATTNFEVEQPDPAITKNPNLRSTDALTWPLEVPQAKFDELQRQANLVRNASDTYNSERLTNAEHKLLSEIDKDIDALFELLTTADQTTRVVKLPDTLSATQLISLTTDESAFMQNLMRPMPRKPAPEATRGTEFHAWVEDYFGVRANANLDDELLARNLEVLDGATLESLKQAFLNGQFASRKHEVLEFPFSIIVAGRPIIGRIDAVFEGSQTDPLAPKWTVIDWKTGAPGSANPLQLHVYRAAWAQHKGVALEQVDAGFYYVAYDQVESVSEVMTIEQLSVLLEGSH